MRLPCLLALALPCLAACTAQPTPSGTGTSPAPSPSTAASSSAAAAPAGAPHATAPEPAQPDAPDATGKRPCEIADYFRRAIVGSPVVSPNGKKIAFTVTHQELETTTSWSEIWIADADGSNARALTTAKKQDTDPKFSPDGRTLLFVSNRSGTSQLWTMPVDGGEPRALTSFGPGLSSPEWSPDGKHVAAVTSIFPECGVDEEKNARIAKGLEDGKLKVHVADELLYRHWTDWHDGRRAHIVLVDAATGKVDKDLTPGPWESPTFDLDEGRGFSFSPDGKELCYLSNHDRKQAESTNADLWIVPLDGEIGETTATDVTAANQGWDGAPLYSPDGKWIAFVSQATPAYESDLRRLAVMDRATKEVRYLTTRESFDDWVDDMRWTSDSSAIVFSADHRGRTPLFKIARTGGAPREVLTDGTIAGFELSADGRSVYYTRSRIGSPYEVYKAPLAGGAPAQITHMNAALEREVDLRPGEEMWTLGEAGYEIHVFVVKPHGFDPSKRYPLILNVHGGPQQQYTDGFRGDWQVYPAKGYVVAFANPTGSTGYGQAFTDAIVGDYGGRVFRDLMRVTDALEALPYVDKDRMGVMGWSFGGSMSMWIEGHTDRFKANASMMGIYDWPSFYGATEELWYPEHDLRGTPWTSEDYVKWSASGAVKSFKTPALVVSGELDYRVPYTQSLAYFTALQKMGVPSRLVLYPNAGHWPAWHEMAFYYDVHLDFFHQHLGGGPAPYPVEAFARNLAFEKK